jgi:hemoglobin
MSSEFEDANRVEVVRIKGLSGEAVEGNFFELVGGTDTFRKLVEKFYEGVASDDVLRPMYPEQDLGPAAERLRMFLEQYWGGPQTYQEIRGHPRLKQRHQPFKINPPARERWLHHMKVACDSLNLAPLQQAQLWGYLDRAATSMLNTFED